MSLKIILLKAEKHCSVKRLHILFLLHYALTIIFWFVCVFVLTVAT